MTTLFREEIEQVAACLWDGGWRADDGKMMREHYPEMDDDEFGIIIECLEKWEGEE